MSTINLCWQGLAETSMEYGDVTISADAIMVRSTVIGIDSETPYRVDYKVTLNRDWVTQNFTVTTQTPGKENTAIYHGDGQGNWYKEGEAQSQFQGCLDIDITVTPFTNSLPVNRCSMKTGETQLIKVIYIDVTEATINAVLQYYTKLSENSYLFETADGDFKAMLSFDKFGLLNHYEGLFKRVPSRE